MMSSGAHSGSESRSILDIMGSGTGNNAFQPSGEAPEGNDGSGFDIASEVKRWQQLYQTTLSGAPTALLSTGSNNLQHDASTAALLQILESQQQRATSSRFDIPLANSMGLVGGTFGHLPGSGTMDSNIGSGDLFNSESISNSGGPLNQLQSNFFTDARLLMAQQAVAAMNFPSFSNPLLLQPALTQSQQGESTSELPLPSPHSLFHRDGSRRMRGGVIEPFPEKLHRLLLEVESAGRSDIISFISGGRAFLVHKPDKFFKDIVPLYFRQSRLSSFKRQLNLYGFELINTGPSRGGYFHELFIKDQPELCRRMRRVAVKVVLKNEGTEDIEQNIMSEIIDSYRSNAEIGGCDH